MGDRHGRRGRRFDRRSRRHRSVLHHRRRGGRRLRRGRRLLVHLRRCFDFGLGQRFGLGHHDRVVLGPFRLGQDGVLDGRGGFLRAAAAVAFGEPFADGRLLAGRQLGHVVLDVKAFGSTLVEDVLAVDTKFLRQQMYARSQKPTS
jgi:hypothetical protein